MNTLPFASQALALGAILLFAASLAHLACILIGAPAYRLMGAGEKMARAAAAGKIQPTVVTSVIALVLGMWGMYALSGVGWAHALPLAKPVLVAVCAVLFGRAFAFPLLKPAFPDNSNTFWLISSGLCLLIAGLCLYGTVGRWQLL